VSTSRILVVGASGMLGHEAMRVLAPDFEVWGACRNPELLPDLGVPEERLLGGLDATDPGDAYRLLDMVEPDVVINALGIVKHRPEATDAIPSIEVNSLWPHVLADACVAANARMVHVSTDCVFSGSRGGYREDDVPDAFDLYGRSKLLGEVTECENVVTLRTSIIGWQLGDPIGLVAWFAAHRHEALKGFTKAVFSGLTTQALTEMIRDVVLPDASLSGLWHVSAEPIDKHTLLSELAEKLDWDVNLTPSEAFVIDRTLDSSRFRERTGWTPPSWDEMLEALAAEWVQDMDADRSTADRAR
jgi:dTDP-4-dehydrorhamnose reductase